MAIIGGFLLTKYLAISSEIAGTENEISDLEDRLAIETEQMHAANLEYATHRAEYDLCTWDNCQLFLHRANAFGPGGPGVTDSDLARHFAEFADHPADVIDALRVRWNAEAERVVTHPAYRTLEEATHLPDWDTFRRDLPTFRDVPLLWEVHHDDVCDRLKKQAAQGQGGAGRLLASLEVAPLAPLDPGHGNVDASLERARDEAARTVDNLQAQLVVAHSRRNRLAKPQGVISGFGWLAVVFALTVVPSMLLLTPQPATLTRTSGSWVLTSYFAGVLVMFGYFATVARGLKGKPRTSLTRP